MSHNDRPRVLVVDDDFESQELYVEILRWAGFDVQTASDGDAAIALAAAEQPQAVVLDIQMPRKDGISVLADLRRSPATASIPVIALTGFSDEADRARVYGGFSQVLEKPCDPHSLIATLRRALNPALDG
jgi:two-component system phosphate regulon response regulator PhoB